MSENFVEIVDRYGRRRRARRGEVLADGERFSLPMTFMDAQLYDALIEKHAGPARAAGALAGHRPGFLLLDRDSVLVDAATEAYEARTRRMATAWQRRHADHQNDHRGGHQDLACGREARPATLDEARAAADAAREARDERLRTAWQRRP
jgi:hypothetical protein